MTATWIACAILVLLHTAAVRDYVGQLDALGRTGGAEVGTPLRQVVPARHADAQMWVRHVIAAEETGVARLRFTVVDNAPTGREVHWSSLPAGLLRGASALQRAATGQRGTAAIEQSLLWFNAPLLLACIIALSAWAGTLAGAGAGVVVAFGMVGHNRFYESFAPVNVDHHGLTGAAVLALLLGLAGMGFGWWKPAAAGPRFLPRSVRQARVAAGVSAAAGAVGVWISAAAVLPVIALAGIGGCIAAWRAGAAVRRDGAQFDPGVWKVWGRVGAAGSLLAYVLECAPAHFSWRLEVNHPLYALAWWGGAELVAMFITGRLSLTAGGEHRMSLFVPRLIAPLLAVLAVPVVIEVAGVAVFAVGDPFVGQLRHFVAEGMSLPALARQFGLRPVLYPLGMIGLLVPVAWVAWRRREASGALLLSVVVICSGLALMGCGEMRWWPVAAAAQIVLLAVLVGEPAGDGGRVAGVWILAAVLVFAGTALQRVAADRSANREHALAAGDVLQPLYRDMAAALRSQQPEGDIVLLASPNASAGIGYFGRFASLGTLYWENAAGLRAAATLLTATRDDEVLAGLRAHRVTHVVMMPAANFIGEYFRLLRPDAPLAEARATFGYRCLNGEAVPVWLQPVPYRCAPEFKEVAAGVRLYRVVEGQTPTEQQYYTALAGLAAGDTARAVQTMDTALAEAPVPVRLQVAEAAGAAFYDYGADAAAVRYLRRALELGADAGVANTLAWILATSREAALRDGRTALALVEPLARREASDPALLSTLAAALAETGRFTEAVQVAERALVQARAGGDAAATALLQRRLDSYRARQQWRQ